MKRTILFLPLLGLLLAGCTHVRTLGSEASYARFNKRASRQDGVIVFRDGKRISDARIVDISPDTLYWFLSRSTFPHQTPTSEIESIQFISPGRGAAQGFGLGILTGAVFGGMAGFMSGDDPPCSPGSWFCWQWTAEDKAKLAGVGLGAIGGLIGLVGGAVTGNQEVYYITPHPPRQNE